jgi:uncharacterized membrane protein YbaN (DUF454 family)
VPSYARQNDLECRVGAGLRRSSGRLNPAVKRNLLFAGGAISLLLGLVGVVVPVLPTTPFLLLAAYCFARSSARAHRWLLTNKVFGRQLRDYLEGRTLPAKVKVGVLVVLWAVMAVSAFVVVGLWPVRAVLLTIALGVTIHLLTLKPAASAARLREGRGRRAPE